MSANQPHSTAEQTLCFNPDDDHYCDNCRHPYGILLTAVTSIMLWCIIIGIFLATQK